MLNVLNTFLIVVLMVKCRTTFCYFVCKIKHKLDLTCTIYHFIFSVNPLQLVGYLQCPIWASIIDNDYLVVISTVKIGKCAN